MWENLLYFLGGYRAQSQLYLGHFFKKLIPRGYASGGAGYVISKPAVRKVVDEGPKFPVACPNDGEIEDLDIGR